MTKDLRIRKTPGNTPPVNPSQFIGILWTAQPSIDLDKLERVIAPWRDMGTNIEFFCYFPKLKQKDTLPTPGIKATEINWYGVPQWDSIQAFINKPLDILVVLDPKPSHPVQYIQSLSAAKFKIGTSSNQSKVLHLMVDCPHPFDLDKFWNDLTFLMHSLSTKS